MINFNGTTLPVENARLSFRNRGFAYGDSVFETLRVINGKIIFWEDHYFRLMASMRIMRMEIPTSFSPEFLEAQIQELLKNNSLDNAAARVRFTTYRREGGYYAPATRRSEERRVGKGW